MPPNGLAKLQRRLNNLPAKAETSIREALAKSADEIVSSMKLLAPVETGELRNSIGWTFGPPSKGSAVTVIISAGNASTMVYNKRGVPFQKARLQEFGTVDMPANPFFFPAYRLGRKRATSRTKRAIRKAVKDSANGN